MKDKRVKEYSCPAIGHYECISLCAWHILFLYSVSQLVHCIEPSLQGLDLFLEIFLWILVFVYILRGTAHIIAVDASCIDEWRPTASMLSLRAYWLLDWQPVCLASYPAFTGTRLPVCSAPQSSSQKICRSYAQNEAQKDHLQRIYWARLLVTFLNAKIHLIVLRRYAV